MWARIRSQRFRLPGVAATRPHQPWRGVRTSRAHRASRRSSKALQQGTGGVAGATNPIDVRVIVERRIARPARNRLPNPRATARLLGASTLARGGTAAVCPVPSTALVAELGERQRFPVHCRRFQMRPTRCVSSSACPLESSPGTVMRLDAECEPTWKCSARVPVDELQWTGAAFTCALVRCETPATIDRAAHRAPPRAAPPVARSPPAPKSRRARSRTP